MRKNISFLLCFVLISFISFAQSAGEKEVAESVETLRKAMISADIPQLKKLTAEELSYGHSSGMVEDKATFVDQFVTGKSVFTSIELSDQTIQIAGNVAIVRHHLKAETNNNKVAGKADILILLIWQKQKGEWKLLARQAVKKPV